MNKEIILDLVVQILASHVIKMMDVLALMVGIIIQILQNVSKTMIV